MEKQLETTYVHGCNRLERYDFKGLEKCKYVDEKKEERTEFFRNTRKDKNVNEKEMEI